MLAFEVYRLLVPSEVHGPVEIGRTIGEQADVSIRGPFQAGKYQCGES
jgi:hypothetical protein